MAEASVDFLLENLKQLLESKGYLFSGAKKLQIRSLCEELSFLRTFLKDAEMNQFEHEEVKDLVTEIRDLAFEAEDIVDSSMANAILKKNTSITSGIFIGDFIPSSMVNASDIIIIDPSSSVDTIFAENRSTSVHRRRGQMFTVGAIMRKKRSISRKIGRIFHPPRMLSDVLKEIKSLKKEVSEIYEKKLYGIGDPHPEVGRSSSSGRSSTDIVLNMEDETVVGFDNDVETIKAHLAGGSKQLDVISIVGMAGLGKTTLAKKLYNDAFVVYHFYIRGWTYVSQVYAKRDLLLSILSSVVEYTDGLYTLSDEKLGEELYKRFKGRRYLIVMDDMWNTRAWDDMRIYFPNDNNGSRIMITSRLSEVALHAKPNSHPHFLHFLTRDESCDLLKQKIFRNESCPPDLVEIAGQIAQKCQGLPLAIVVIAGVLARTDMTQDQWKKIAASLSSHIASDPDKCMDTLALSYNHLPHHLKLCFLYFGVFPEDFEISMRKLIWLWIAEGFIPRIGQKTLEDIAEEYLIDLIDRSLVLVAKRKSTGGIRACRVHDLLRDLCLRKGKEENFMQQIYGDEILSSHSSYPIATKKIFLFNLSRFFNLSHALCLKKVKIPKKENTLQQEYDHEEASSSYSSKKESSIRQDSEYEQTSSYSPHSCVIPTKKKHRRLCIFSHVLDYVSLTPSAPHIRSLLCFASEQSPLLPKNISCIYEAFKLLRVLDLSVISLPYFPNQIVCLVLLRYLAIQGKKLILPPSMSNLMNLETLVVSPAMKVFVPADIWRMVSLRHIRIAGASYEKPWTYSVRTPMQPNLQTILHLPTDESYEIILAQTPNLRKLGFCGPMVSTEGKLWFPNLVFLNHLETLKLLNRAPVPSVRWNLQGLKFPLNLRRLTLSNTYLDWEEMSTLGMLCNLEVLKLEFLACVGPRWETSGGGFRRLKFLRLYYIGIEQWEASNIHFPSLQRLVLHRCGKLEGIPLEFGNILTLQTIEVSWCSQSTANSARNIQEEQQGFGNDGLKILIIPPEWELPTYF